MMKNCRRMPKGYRFAPYNIELVNYYLRKKINQETLPYNIPDINIYDHTPEQLYGMFASPDELGVVYCFTPRFRSTKRDNRPKRSVKNDGYWRKTTGQIKIHDKQDELIGFRTTLVYWKGKGKDAEKTSWIMQEYTLSTQTPLHDKQNELKLDDWVLCKIYIATKGSKDNAEERYHPYTGKKKSSPTRSSSPIVDNTPVEQQENFQILQPMDSSPCSVNHLLNIEDELLESSQNSGQSSIGVVQEMNYSLPEDSSPCLINHLQNIEEELLGSSQNSDVVQEMNYSSVEQQNIYNEYEQLLVGQCSQYGWTQMYPEPEGQLPFPQENTRVDSVFSYNDIEHL